MESCPICSNKITFFPDESGGDFYEITCHTRCGEYFLTRNALDKLQNKPLSIQNIANISGFLCENQGTEIDVERLKSLINLNSPTFHEKADKILLYLEKESQYAGALVSKTVKLQGIGWCVNYEEFGEIIGFLESVNRLLTIGGSKGVRHCLWVKQNKGAAHRGH